MTEDIGAGKTHRATINWQRKQKMQEDQGRAGGVGLGGLPAKDSKTVPWHCTLSWWALQEAISKDTISAKFQCSPPSNVCLPTVIHLFLPSHSSFLTQILTNAHTHMDATPPGGQTGWLSYLMWKVHWFYFSIKVISWKCLPSPLELNTPPNGKRG